MYFCSEYISPVGKMTIASNENSIVGLWIEGQKYFMDILQGKEYETAENEVIILAKNWLDKYFNNERPKINDLPIEFFGSDFRIAIWNMLTEIPYGEVITYKDIAKHIAQMKGIEVMSCRAVGGAVGHNPISVIVPCHRVIGANGRLTGYSGGINIKRKLLEYEGVDISSFYITDNRSFN